MPTAARERRRAYHAAKIDEWGICDARSLGYSGEASQRARFEVISDLYDGQGSVLDVGCGTGQLLGHLRRRYGHFDYVGIDEQDRFIRCAEYTYRDDPRCRFVTADFAQCALPSSDVVIACGALSYRSPDCEYHVNCIERFVAVAGRALILNILDSSRMFSGEVIVGHNVAAVMDYCRTLTAHVVVVEGYLPFDVTIMLQKRCEEGDR